MKTVGLLTSVGLLFRVWYWWMSFFLFFLAKPFDLTFFLSCTVSNVICCLVFGQRFSYDDKHFLYLLQIISDTLKFGSSSQGQVKAIVTITWNWHGGWVIRRRVLGLDLKCLKKVAQNRADCAHQLLCSHCNNNLLKNSLSMCHKWMLQMSQQQGIAT